MFGFLKELKESVKEGWEEAKQEVEEEEGLGESLEKSVKALCAAISSFLLVSAVDLEYIEKQTALDVLHEVSLYVQDSFADWQEFGDHFLAGNKVSELNNGAGQKFLEKYVGYLERKPGSPWQNVSIKPGV